MPPFLLVYTKRFTQQVKRFAQHLKRFTQRLKRFTQHFEYLLVYLREMVPCLLRQIMPLN